MTIEKEGYLYCLYCDICGEKADESFNKFMDAGEGGKTVIGEGAMS